MKTQITQDWLVEWSPKSYLEQYYLTPRIPADEQSIFSFIHRYMGRTVQRVPLALDFGVGPTLHHEIGLVPFADEIHVADLLPSNLTEIQRWLDGSPTAHDWGVYLQGVLALEGTAPVTAEQVEARKRLVRERVRRLLVGDIRDAWPLGSGAQYPLVTAFYVADSVAQTLGEWRVYMRNLSQLVAPGGILLVSALRNAEFYQVGSAYFPSANVSEADMEAIYADLGFAADSVVIQVSAVPEWDDEGFDSIIVAAGIKDQPG